MSTPEGVLIDAVMASAEADDSLNEDCRLTLYAALTGDDDLQGELTGIRGRGNGVDQNDEHSEASSQGVYLKSIVVAGFRGVGAEARLDLQPGPGITIVAGRNGCGKSSFSEGLEVALTGTSYRWQEKNVQWKDGWRNVHVSDPRHVKIEAIDEGTGVSTLGVDWRSGAELDDGDHWAQRAGEKRDRTDDPFGWSHALELYRPVLSYDELGGILEAKPSELYDRIWSVLGLGAIADARERLDATKKELGKADNEAKAAVRELKVSLSESDDARAMRAAELLKARRPDVDELERLATGGSETAIRELTTLRAITNLRLPPAEEIARAAADLLAAHDDLVRAASEIGASVEIRRDLLTHALKHVDASGSGPCPVCGVGMLDDAWATQARRAVADLETTMSAHNDAKRRRAGCEAMLRALSWDVPPELTMDLGFDLPGRTETSNAWRAMRSEDITTIAGIQAFHEHHSLVASRLAELKTAAASEITKREDTWAPLAQQLAELAGHLRRSAKAEPKLKTAKAATDWLRNHADGLRQDRFRPITDKARQIWSVLRLNSSVELSDIELTGSKTRRRVAMSGAVDGQDVESAVAVMSQGELHALALALFLPRATLDASPFRFVVIDDPVQAMDPAKVDALARVLDALAETRQVVVFTHDNRLPQAVRDLGIAARILEIDRSTGSRVEVRNASDPARRSLEDAVAIAKNKQAGDETKRRVVPQLCRQAVETACRDVAGRQLAGGKSRDAIEKEWDDAVQTKHKIAYALYGDSTVDLGPWLAKSGRRRGAMGVIGPAVHQGLTRDPLEAVNDVRLLIDDIEAGRR